MGGEAQVFRRRGLVHVQRLLLSRCAIVDVHRDALYGLTNLVELDLSHNALVHVPSAALHSVPQVRAAVPSARLCGFSRWMTDWFACVCPVARPAAQRQRPAATAQPRPGAGLATGAARAVRVPVARRGTARLPR